jgi:hypothetical protein
MLLSGSRDKTLIIWNLTRDEQAYGYPKRSLEGHSHIVSDCVCLRLPLPQYPEKPEEKLCQGGGTEAKASGFKDKVG